MGGALVGENVETFAALSELDFVRHGFVTRVAGLDVKIDRDAALERLREHHERARKQLGMEKMKFVTAEQVHGNNVAIVDEKTLSPVPNVDGLVTAQRGVCFGIYVADCAAVFLVDPSRRVIGLVHSGKKGTDLEIVPVAIQQMRAHFQSDPRDIIVQISPCIRPPHYEIDFASRITAQCRENNVNHIFDCYLNTGADTQRYYSYRIERGKTGRMLALLALS